MKFNQFNNKHPSKFPTYTNCNIQIRLIFKSERQKDNVASHQLGKNTCGVVDHHQKT